MVNKQSSASSIPEKIPNMLWNILGIAALLRLFHLTGFSLSNDELSALARLQFDSVREVISQGVYPDYHPAGVQLFLYFWTSIFGFSEWVVRLPFALMGIGSVYFIYRIGNSWFGTATGLLASAALAVLQFPLLYSQIARPYSPGLFFTLMATFFWTQYLFNSTDKDLPSSNKWKYLLAFVLSVSACMYIHYFSFIFAGILCFSGLFFLKRQTFFPFLVAGAAIVLLYLPHLEIFIHQLSKGGVGGAEGWLGPPGKDAFGKYLDYCFNDSSQLKLIFFIIASGTILLFRKEIKLNRFHLLAGLLFIIPFAIAYYYSIWKNPVFQYSVMLFSFPYLLLLLFSFIPRLSSGLTIRVLLLAILVGGIYSTVFEQKYYSTAHFSEFRGLASRVKELDEKFGANQITKTISVFDPYYIQYYLDKVQHPAKFEITSIMSSEERRKFRKLVEQSKTPYFIYAFSNVYDDPNLDFIVRSSYPWVLLRDSMLNSGLRFYSKSKSDSALNRLPLLSLQNGFEKGTWKNESACWDSSNRYEGNYSLLIKEDSEFSPGLEQSLNDLGILPGSTIEMSIAFMSDKKDPETKLVLSIEKDNKNFYYGAASFLDYADIPGSWSRTFLTAKIPTDVTGNETIKIYCWNDKKEKVWIDDFRMSIYSPR